MDSTSENIVAVDTTAPYTAIVEEAPEPGRVRRGWAPVVVSPPYDPDTGEYDLDRDETTLWAMVDGTLTPHVAEGDVVERGDVVFTVETTRPNLAKVPLQFDHYRRLHGLLAQAEAVADEVEAEQAELRRPPSIPKGQLGRRRWENERRREAADQIAQLDKARRAMRSEMQRQRQRKLTRHQEADPHRRASWASAEHRAAEVRPRMDYLRKIAARHATDGAHRGRSQYPDQWSMINALRGFYKLRGRWPRKAELGSKTATPSRDRLRDAFGSLTEAKAAAAEGWAYYEWKMGKRRKPRGMT